MSSVSFLRDRFDQTDDDETLSDLSVEIPRGRDTGPKDDREKVGNRGGRGYGDRDRPVWMDKFGSGGYRSHRSRSRPRSRRSKSRSLRHSRYYDDRDKGGRSNSRKRSRSRAPRYRRGSDRSRSRSQRRSRYFGDSDKGGRSKSRNRRRSPEPKCRPRSHRSRSRSQRRLRHHGERNKGGRSNSRSRSQTPACYRGRSRHDTVATTTINPTLEDPGIKRVNNGGPGFDSNKRTELHEAAENGNLQVFQSLMKSMLDDSVLDIQGFNPEDNEGQTPFHLAAKNGHLEICRIIMANVVDKNPINHDGETPSQLAAYHRHFSVMELIKSALSKRVKHG